MPTQASRHPLLTSLTRIADFDSRGFEVKPWPRQDWDTGDYVLAEVTSAGVPAARLELATGREMFPAPGDTVIGALGVRAATLEVVGDWRAIGPDGMLSAMTGAGLFGRITSMSSFIGDVVSLRYVGHLIREAVKLNMRDFVQTASPAVAFNCPTILIIGTSMSSGKTMSGRVLVRLLARRGLRVVGAKLTGAGRYRDMLALSDAGAADVFDFVDCGLPSTICSPETFQASLEVLLSQIAAAQPDIVVAEAGASPLEPYNGEVAIDRVRPYVRYTILCASDPYAAVGVTQGFGFQPDLVAGVATSTTAGCRVVEELTGLSALNLQDPESINRIEHILRKRFGF